MAAVVLAIGDDVSTDVIYPGRYMATVLPAETPQFAFADDAAFNARLRAKEAPPGSVIVAGRNFGCGSSREHAPWALLDFGIRCVIAPSFADIFFNNCFKNGILPIVLPQEQVEILSREAGEAADPTFTVDLEKQEIHRPTGNEVFRFEIDPFAKHCLLHGLDDVGLTMKKVERIGDFEARQRAQQPWLYHEVA